MNAPETTISATRAANLAKVVKHYQISEWDAPSVLVRPHPRYALVTQYDGGFRAHLADELPLVESLAARLVTDADSTANEVTQLGSPFARTESVVCYFDLDDHDERMPARYDLAKVVVSVVFNTVAS